MRSLLFQTKSVNVSALQLGLITIEKAVFCRVTPGNNVILSSSTMEYVPTSASSDDFTARSIPEIVRNLLWS